MKQATYSSARITARNRSALDAVFCSQALPKLMLCYRTNQFRNFDYFTKRDITLNFYNMDVSSPIRLRTNWKRVPIKWNIGIKSMYFNNIPQSGANSQSNHKYARWQGMRDCKTEYALALYRGWAKVALIFPGKCRTLTKYLLDFPAREKADKYSLIARQPILPGGNKKRKWSQRQK